MCHGAGYCVAMLAVAGAVLAGLACGKRAEPAGPHAYAAGDMEGFQKVLAGGGWKATEPPRNEAGMLTALHERTGLTFVLVPGGTFQMGSTEHDQKPIHPVSVRAFLLSSTECTQAAWEKGGGANGSQWKGPQLPVEKVDWNEGREWCGRNGLRLPSEAEWECACRAGTTTKYWFGDDEGRLADHAWYKNNGGDQTHPVGDREKANPWGLFDMHGNVWEWVEDWYGPYSEAPTDGNARTSQGASSFRVFRGGSWDVPAGFCPSDFRYRDVPGSRDSYLGFRPAASL